jgi:hypothetical protein
LPVSETRTHPFAPRALALALTLPFVGACAPAGPRNAPVPTSSPSPPRPVPPSTAAPATPRTRELPWIDPAAALPPPPAPPSAELDPLPPGFERTPDLGRTPCGDFGVEHFSEAQDKYTRFVRVFRTDGTKVYEAHGRTIVAGGGDRLTSDLIAEFCGDLTLDGVPEILLTEKSAGAHCCYTHYVVSLASPPKRILFWEKGDAGTPVLPVRYRPDGPFQLEGYIVHSPPFDPQKGEPSLPYAMIPVVPAVFSFVGGEYRLTSFSFPEAYRKDRQERRASCENRPFGCNNDISEWIDALIIGDWDAEKSALADTELRQILERHSVATRKQLLKKLGSLERPAPTR